MSIVSAPHVLLMLMVRNEAKIIERCLRTSGPDVDAVLLADTGSDDDTVALAERFCAELGKPLRVERHEWRDFGHNRTLAFKASVKYARALKWELDATWAFAQDPDMVWRSKHPIKRWLQANPMDAYLVQQTNVGMEYLNLRLLRLSKPWRSVGVTHECWMCEEEGFSVARVAPEVGDFDDLGDGGCKADKFERDARLLEAGLEVEPDNQRYVFYLAQTYFYLQRYDDAIRCYKRRVESPFVAEDEEVWYSKYRIATCNFAKGDAVEGEYWALQAAKANAERAEPLMLMVDFFRLQKQYFKAWQYLLLAEAVPLPSKPYLFYELDANGHRKAFEKSLLSFNVSPDMGAGLDLCLTYEGPPLNEAHTLINAAVYAQQVPARLCGKLEFPVPEGYVSSSISVGADGSMVVRAVDYFIEATGTYTLRDGQFVRTLNFRASWDADNLRWSCWREFDAPALPSRPEARILGLEDVRLCGSNWTATTVEFSYCDANRMVWGDANGCKVLKPPGDETPCEKNWLPLHGRLVIYAWHPLVVGMVPIKGDQLLVVNTHPTPKWFRHLRGSAPPVELEDGFWTLTHLVAPSAPRAYLHCWVVLDKATLKPIKASRPFWFKHRGIEYCLGVCAAGGGKTLQCFVSVWDRESWMVALDVAELRRGLRDL